MASGARGVIAGGLALVALQAVVSSPQAGHLASLFRIPGQAAVRFLDPTVPAIPDRSGGDNEDTGGLRAGGLGGVTYPDPKRKPAPLTTGGD